VTRFQLNTAASFMLRGCISTQWLIILTFLLMPAALKIKIGGYTSLTLFILIVAALAGLIVEFVTPGEPYRRFSKWIDTSLICLWLPIYGYMTVLSLATGII